MHLTMGGKGKGEEAAAKKEEAAAAEQEQEVQQQIWSWGAGTDGQLGTGKLEDEHLPQLLRLPALSSSSSGSVFTLACGGAHVIALTHGGKVLTWGRGTAGQLGHGDMVNNLYPKAVTFLDSYRISQVSAGWSHSGFVSDNGCVFTCGDGSFGQLGHGDYGSHSLPVKVSFFDDKQVDQIACGMRHSLVLLKGYLGNQVYAFGSGKRGQLGISVDKVKFVSLPQFTCGFEDTEIVSIGANGDHSAALSADGRLYTWGRGFPCTPDVKSPRCLSSSLWFTQVALGWNHALMLTGEGEVFMLGGNRHGVLCDLEKMNTMKNDATEAPLGRVSSLDGVKVVQLAAGAEHSSVVTAGGAIKTWGWGEHGQLGLGSTSDHTDPRAVSLGDKVQYQESVAKVYCGSGFTYAIMSLSLQKPCDVSR